jgi:hypothetical protein
MWRHFLAINLDQVLLALREVFVDIWDVREALCGVHSKFTRALFCPRASYKLKRA